MKQQVVIIGGGAAGFFAAIELAAQRPDLAVTILEQGNEVLGKVKISGGGRCNVTHACFDPKELVRFYPRGNKELLGAFHRFHCAHTVEWFEQRGVELKTESDGRMFPVTNSSQAIIDCLLDQAKMYNIRIVRQAKVTRLEALSDGFTVYVHDRPQHADYLLVASGSSNTLWNLLKQLGHRIIPPVPSLFTFNIKSPLLQGLEGVSVERVTVQPEGSKQSSEGPLLVTHWGLSGPAILKLSAFAALELAEKQYRFNIRINWIQETADEAKAKLTDAKQTQPKKNLLNFCPFPLPARFWKSCIAFAGIREDKKYADLSKEDIRELAQLLTACILSADGKSTNKDEFVTAGGIDLKEVDFKTMQSRLFPRLYFAGEVLNIDAVTGGFNFQAAWTTGHIAGVHMAENA
ncbi:MAG: NAD(P)/FAD-dependent oxidoreductase [Chitinophagales bacterium]|nr:NAD(P)/FAD-dependent oxidoreductase [Chitinophagales bacterium]